MKRLPLLALAAGLASLTSACGARCDPDSGLDTGSGTTDGGTTDGGTTDGGTTDGGTDTGRFENPDTVSLTEHGVVTCEDPGPRDVSPFTTADLGRDWAYQNFDIPTKESSGGGLTVADLNGDGRLDVYFPQWLDDQIFIQQEDGTLVDETEARYPEGLVSSTATAAAVDYDGDGDLDLYLCNNEGGDHLLNNDGNGYFSDVTAGSGFEGYERRCTDSAWGDIDGDGDLDTWLSTYISCEVEVHNGPSNCVVDDPAEIEENRNLFFNNGDGTFTDVTPESGLPSLLLKETLMHTSALFDADGDGDLDIYVVSDFRSDVPWDTPDSSLFLNDGTGHFTQADESAGIQIKMSGMGIGIGDLNGDELPDLMVSDLIRMWMFESLSPDVWIDTTISRGLNVPPDVDGLSTGWGTELCDIDNDGDLDGVMVFGRFGYGQPIENSEPDRIWVQNDTGKFSDKAAEWGVNDPGLGRGVITIDYNGDGYLDLFKPQLGDYTNYYQSNCGEDAWLQVDLRGPSPNVFGIGAVIRARSGDQSWIRWILAGSTGIGTSSQPLAHFGFGDVDTLDELEITWPDGERAVFYDVTTRQRVTVNRTE